MSSLLCLSGGTVKSWFIWSGKYISPMYPGKSFHLKIIYLLSGGELSTCPKRFQGWNLSVAEDIVRDKFERNRHELKLKDLRDQVARRRSVLNTSPFFTWFAENHYWYDYRLLSEDELIHPMSFDLPVSQDIISTTEPKMIPLDTIVYHSFTQAITQSRVNPLSVTMGFRLRSHASISGREVNIEDIRSHNANELASWFVVTIPKIWRQVSRKYPHLKGLKSFDKAIEYLEDDVLHEHGFDTILDSIGVETVHHKEGTSFLEEVIREILIARIYENCRDEILVGVNPLIGFIMDHPELIFSVVDELVPSLSAECRRIFPVEEQKDEEKKNDEQEMDEDAHNIWKQLNESRYKFFNDALPEGFASLWEHQQKEIALAKVCLLIFSRIFLVAF